MTFSTDPATGYFMQKSFGCADPKIISYVEKTFAPEDGVLKKTRESSVKAGLPPIQLGSMDALHVEVLTQVSQAKKAVEIGTLGGYSGIAILRGMGKKGKLFTCEIDSHHARVAEENFKQAGFEKNVKILVGPALKTLPTIEKNGLFDLVFIDADKESYPEYLEWADKNLKVGGLILADNTFAFGHIADVTKDKEIKGLQEFNSKLATSPHFRATILPTGEGLTVGVKIKVSS